MNIYKGDELFQTPAQQAEPPTLPTFSVDELLALGVTLMETDKTRLLTVPITAQRFLVEATKRFGFGSSQALDQVMRRILVVFGIKGRAKFYTNDAFDWCVTQNVSDHASAPVIPSANYPAVLVGLVGLRRSGKDTAAQALIDDGFENVKFAGALKHMLCAYLSYRGVSRDEIHALIEGDRKEERTPLFEGESTRWAMQSLGTEWGRVIIGDSIWVNTALDVCKQHEKVVVTDCRFPNEVEAIRSLGGKIIKVVRPATKIDSHPSEASIQSLPFDSEVWNNGSIEQLHVHVRAAVTELFS